MLFSKIAKTLFFSSFLLSNAEARIVHDATGISVEVKDHPTRIVTLMPGLAELVADLSENTTESLVGVVDYSIYPPAVKKTQSVGNYAKINLEKVLSLKPDLVLASTDGNSKEQITHLRELSIPVVVIASGDFNQVEGSMRLVGEAMGAQNRAEKMVTQFETGLTQFRARAKLRPPRRVLLQLGENPLIVVGGGSFLSQACELLGATDIYSNSPIHYPRPAIEDVIRRNPEVIVVLALDDNLNAFVDMANAWKAYRSLSAVQAKKVSVLHSDALIRPTLRLLEGLALLEKVIYGHL